MCTCIDNIKTSYADVRRNTSRIARKSFGNPTVPVGKTYPDVDDFLDAINVITKELQQTTQSVNDLIEVVRNNFCGITTSEAKELLSISQPINEKMLLLHRKLLKSPLYVGMETTVKLYEDAMSDFEELCHDLKTFRIDLEQNADFQESLHNLTESLKR